MKCLEFFSGLGGWRYALGEQGRILAAFDISPAANATYAINHGITPIAKELASVPASLIQSFQADTWLMSPPCQPFCRMGKGEGLQDKRSKAFLNLLSLFEECLPERVALENVQGFLGSDAHQLLNEKILKHRYHVRDFTLCPTRLGIPNQRPRAYVIASRSALLGLPLPSLGPGLLGPYLDEPEDGSLYLPEPLLVKHRGGMDCVRADEARSSCFIGGYGRKYVGSGSFLLTQKGIRRFSTYEVARLLGLPENFQFPQGMELEQRYKILGNSLNIPVTTWVLQHFSSTACDGPVSGPTMKHSKDCNA